MTEEQKQRELQIIAENARNAEQFGMEATARSWWEMYATVAARPAEQMVLARARQDKPRNPI